jgi:hypothetical protein
MEHCNIDDIAPIHTLMPRITQACINMYTFNLLNAGDE